MLDRPNPFNFSISLHALGGNPRFLAPGQAPNELELWFFFGDDRPCQTICRREKPTCSRQPIPARPAIAGKIRKIERPAGAPWAACLPDFSENR